MRKSTFSRLAVIGLAALATTVSASHNVHGQIRLDSSMPSKPSTAKDRLDVSRVRLDLSGDVAKNWDYAFRLESLGQNAPQFLIAQGTFSGLHNTNINVGLTNGPWYSAQHLSEEMGYTLGLSDGVGLLRSFNGYRSGLNLNSSMGPLGVSAGLWKSTDSAKIASMTIAPNAASPWTDTLVPVVSTSTAIRYGYGARVAFTPANSNDLGYSVAFALSKDALPEPFTVITGFDANYVAAAETQHAIATAFNDRFDFTLDATAFFNALALRASYSNGRIDKALSAQETTPVDTMFDQDGKSHGYNVSVGYIVMGQGYRLDGVKGALSGVNLRDGHAGLEVGFSYGTQQFKNAAALDAIFAETGSLAELTATGTATSGHNTQGATYCVTSTDITASGVATPGDLVWKNTAYTLNANYYFNKNVNLKAEYYNAKNKINRFGAGFVDSRFLPKEAGFNLRAEFNI